MIKLETSNPPKITNHVELCEFFDLDLDDTDLHVLDMESQSD